MFAKNNDKPKRIALALETATSHGAVAIGRGGVVVESRTFGGAFTHAATLLPTIAAICEDIGATPDDLADIYVSAGPGSFTGLRVGITAARILAMAVGARTVAVPTLSVIAVNALKLDPPPQRVAVILNSRRRRAYAGVFTLSQGGYAPADPPLEVDAAQFIRTHGARCAYLGDAVGTYTDVLREVGGHRTIPDDFHHPRVEVVYQIGANLAAAGQFTPPRELVPCYISRPEAEVQWSAAQARKP